MVLIPKKVYERMSSGGLFASLDSDRLTRHGGDVQWQCHIAMTSAHFVMAFYDIYTEGYEAKYAERDEMRALVCAHYFSYIPYGEAGYEAAERIIREDGRYASLTELRMAKLCRRMGDDYALLTKEGEALVREFLDGYRKDTYELASRLDVARLFCRGLAAAEAHYGAHAYSMRDHNEKFSRSIFDRYASEEKILAADALLAAARPAPALDDGDLAFLRECLAVD